MTRKLITVQKSKTNGEIKKDIFSAASFCISKERVAIN